MWRYGGWFAAAAGILCYLNSLANGFVYDDIGLIVRSERIRSLAHPAEIWLSDWWATGEIGSEAGERWRDRLYRPLTVQSFALNHATTRLNPAPYHAANILLHGLASFLVWHFARRLSLDAVVATLAAVLFAVHPIHAEAVANTVGRAELLATVFLLGGLLVLLPQDRSPGAGRAAAASALFLAALFSKETAICYAPVGLLVLGWATIRPTRGAVRWWLTHAALLLAPLAIYLPLRYVALEHQLMWAHEPDPGMNPLALVEQPDRLLHALTIVGHYVRLVLAPVQLRANYGLAVIDPRGGIGTLALLGVLGVVGVGAALVGLFRGERLWRTLGLLSAVLVVSYALISNMLILIGVSLAERLFYWPSVPVLLGLTLVITTVWRRAVAGGLFSGPMHRFLQTAGVALLVALALRSAVRSADWRSNLTLFGGDVQHTPESAALNVAYAGELLREAERALQRERMAQGVALLKGADQHLAQALQIHPNSLEALQLRGRTLILLGRPEEARLHLVQASQIDPADRQTRRLLDALGGEENAAALDQIEQRLTTRPSDAALRLEQAALLLRLGRDAEAVANLQALAQDTPDEPAVLHLLGDAYLMQDSAEQARAIYQRALALDPSRWQTHLNMATLLAQDQPAEALGHAVEANRLAPQQPETNRQLAELLALNGRRREAVERLQMLLQALPPGDPQRGQIEARLAELRR